MRYDKAREAAIIDVRDLKDQAQAVRALSGILENPDTYECFTGPYAMLLDTRKESPVPESAACAITRMADGTFRLECMGEDIAAMDSQMAAKAIIEMLSKYR